MQLNSKVPTPLLIPLLVVAFTGVLSSDAFAEQATDWRLSLELGTVVSRTSSGDLADTGLSPPATLAAPTGSVMFALEFPEDDLVGISFESGIASGVFRTFESWRLLVTLPLHLVTRLHFDDFSLRLIAGFQLPIWYDDAVAVPYPVPALGLGTNLWDGETYRWFFDFEWVPVILPFATAGEEGGSFVEFYLFTVGVSR